MRLRALAVLGTAAFVTCITWDSAPAITGWAQPAYSATLSPNIAGVGQAGTDSKVLTLDHDGDSTIQASVTQAGDEVLTHQTTGDTLVTSYKLTGAALGASSDTDWVSSSDFIAPARSYSVGGVGPSEITFHVRGAAAPARASDAGTYTASIVLTVLW
ncbi:MAG: hypothetical protein AMK72_10765 [Planctomycetes bacterium SM23_25]|nr:MAG: hypothetical protein AMK72_10765 [Planctomycetes bacterium SM23_25]